MTAKRPACFDSAEQWAQYSELAEFSGGAGFTFCTDCTPEYQAQMLAAGRCAHPGTTFIIATGVLVGRRKK